MHSVAFFKVFDHWGLYALYFFSDGFLTKSLYFLFTIGILILNPLEAFLRSNPNLSSSLYSGSKDLTIDWFTWTWLYTLPFRNLIFLKNFLLSIADTKSTYIGEKRLPPFKILFFSFDFSL